MKSVAVFCSANKNLDASIFKAASEFSEGLVSRGLELIYGGASVGLMGHFADEVLKLGGVVRGAITNDLAKSSKEMAHTGITELVYTKDLFERKVWMIQKSDAFVLFPGGYGTLDEALEVISLKTLSYHDKPIVFVNVGGFWQTQLQVFKEFEKRGMVRARPATHSPLFEVCDTIDEVWRALK